MSSATERTREVTKILADLDYLFSFGKNSDGAPVWQLVPFNVPPQPVSVTLLLTDLWLYAYHTSQLKRRLDADTLVELLKLNANSSGAKICWISPPVVSEPGGISVTAEISLARLSAESLNLAIGAVVYLTQEVRKIIPTELLT